MKKFYTNVACMFAAMACMPVANAQQLTNSNFEDEWVDCVPWTFYISEGDQFGQQSTAVVTDMMTGKKGERPAGWCISSVVGMASYNDGDPTGLGATIVGEKTEGFESATGVKLTNTANPFMPTQIVPAYLTLGTSWSTAYPGFGADFSIVVNEADGGSFGGIEFTGRPSGIEFMYKNSADNTDKSTVVAYLWKGHWTQKDVPVTIYMDPAGRVVKDLVDRDRCVLGMDMTGLQGGEVTKSDDAELIGVLKGEITEASADWKKFSGKFEYFSNATPEMLNVIIAAGDYFAPAADVKVGNTLTVDNVNLIYASEDGAVDYPGYLNIEMAGNKIAEDQPATLKITSTGDNSCKIVLPNLTLEGLGNLGDIVVDNVATKEADGTTEYEGSVKGMQLLNGAIEADVNLKGTSTNGVINMQIDVAWMGMTIAVTFTTDKQSGVAGMTVENEAPVFYNLQGQRVNADSLTPGLYVKRQGNKSVRILVK